MSLDMSLNAGKSCCICIGSRFDKPCANVCTHDGRQLSWVKELRYLGIFIVSSRNIKCSLDHINALSTVRQIVSLVKSGE